MLKKTTDWHILAAAWAVASLAASRAVFASAVPQEWALEVSSARQYQINTYHGSTLELAASFYHNGKPWLLTGDWALFWQTNGMGSAWWTAPATASSNTVSAVFTAAMDPGADIVYGFLGSTGVNYQAAFTCRYQHSPGATPNPLPLPVETLDFTKIVVVNPPWPAEIAAATNSLSTVLGDSIAELSGDLVSATNSLSTVLGDSIAESARSSTNYTDTAIRSISFPVTSVNSKTGAVLLIASDVGALPTTGGTMTGSLTMDESVIELKDNTGYKRVLRCTGSGGDFIIEYYNNQGTLISSLYVPATSGTLARLQDIPSVAGLAPSASPVFTGTPRAPTPTIGDNSTKVATTEFVQREKLYRQKNWSGSTPPGENTVSYYTLTSSTATLEVANSSTFRSGYILDFIVDVNNLTSSQATINFGGLGGDWYAVVNYGEDLTDMTTLASNEIARFYFKQMSFTKNNKPVMWIAKHVVTEVQSGGGSYQLETDGTVTTEGGLNADGTFTVEGELNADGTFTVEAL